MKPRVYHVGDVVFHVWDSGFPLTHVDEVQPMLHNGVPRQTQVVVASEWCPEMENIITLFMHNNIEEHSCSFAMKNTIRSVILYLT